MIIYNTLICAWRDRSTYYVKKAALYIKKKPLLSPRVVHGRWDFLRDSGRIRTDTSCWKADDKKYCT